MREKLIDDKLKRAIKAAGGMYIKLLTPYLAGLPDRLILLPSARFVFVELKTTGKKPSPLQKIMHTKLKNLGFTVLIIDDAESLDNFIITI